MMEARTYTRLDRQRVMRTLESRLSATENPVSGPQVQLFRIDSPSNAAPPILAMPHRRPDEEHRHEELSNDTSTTRPTEDLIQSYKKRIQVMQSIINQLRAAVKERQTLEDDAKLVREELNKAKLRIAGLEDELERGASDLKDMVEKHDAAILNEESHHKADQESEERCHELEHANEDLAKRCATQEGPSHASNDIIRLHHVIWGSESIYDEALDRRLLDYATQGCGFALPYDLIDRDVRPHERRMLIVAYSKAPRGPICWLIMEDGHEGKFEL
ncbi:hypothetical protein F4804DRAFT_323341 [Jackrogersella minutella]|nr:hypothetical protein F4804DRAFT_323341 [Jackrogersella minutella]